MRFPAVRDRMFFPVGAGDVFPAPVFLRRPRFNFRRRTTRFTRPAAELKFFAPTAPDKPWTSGSFGCVRDNGTRMHEGLDIRHLQTDKRGEPTDPVMATADGTVVYFSKKPGLSNYGNYIVVRHVSKAWKFIRSTRI